MDQDYRMADAGQGLLGKSQEEHGRLGGSHWERDVRSLMQSFWELFEHFR